MRIKLFSSCKARKSLVQRQYEYFGDNDVDSARFCGHLHHRDQRDRGIVSLYGHNRQFEWLGVGDGAKASHIGRILLLRCHCCETYLTQS